ncbi:hypothetical protein GGI12_001055, partial [Dipsacomyces acuminosporus]
QKPLDYIKPQQHSFKQQQHQEHHACPPLLAASIPTVGAMDSSPLPLESIYIPAASTTTQPIDIPFSSNKSIHRHRRTSSSSASTFVDTVEPHSLASNPSMVDDEAEPTLLLETARCSQVYLGGEDIPMVSPSSPFCSSTLMNTLRHSAHYNEYLSNFSADLSRRDSLVDLAAGTATKDQQLAGEDQLEQQEEQEEEGEEFDETFVGSLPSDSQVFEMDAEEFARGVNKMKLLAGNYPLASANAPCWSSTLRSQIKAIDLDDDEYYDL